MPLSCGRDLKPRVFQCLDQEAAHVVVVFGEEDLVHGGQSSLPAWRIVALTKPDRG